MGRLMRDEETLRRWRSHGAVLRQRREVLCASQSEIARGAGITQEAMRTSPAAKAARLRADRAGAPNVWLGTSVEDQERADERIPHLLGTPAAVRFLSVEPLLGPVDLRRAWLRGIAGENTPVVSWVIVGGESGAQARPFDLAWARLLRDQCETAGVAFFMKQTGARVIGPDSPTSLRRWILEDGGEWVPPVIGRRAHERPLNAIGWVPAQSHGAKPSEWPEDLRIQEFPQAVAVRA